MDNNHPDRVAAFDALFTTNHIQMLKVLLGYMEPPVQSQLAIYIKFLELQYTLNFFRNHPSASVSASIPPCSGLSRPENGITGLLDEILPFCSSSEREKIQMFKNMYQNLENIQEMMQMLDMLREISPELFSGSGSPDGSDSPGGFGNASGLSGILSGLGGMDMSQITDMMELMQGIFENK